ncbi:uncharacterized protein LOC135151244 [Daucus carota subsp. sativus]|uniref:uncharacterized protein LOC135151244 n=1 Tax=Daucus carota subsp. sativus TaxID=79200 RepID=UPI003083BB74
MSMMGELSFFLGLQVSQKNDGNFICQSKYVRDLLRKYNLEGSSPAKTPMATATKLGQNKSGKKDDISSYRGCTDSDYAGCRIDRKSTSGSYQFLGRRNQLNDYGLVLNKIPIFCDNTSAIAISINHVQHSRTKHIDIRYHFIREHVMNGTVVLLFVPSADQIADIFTKPLGESTFSRLELTVAITLSSISGIDTGIAGSLLNQVPS